MIQVTLQQGRKDIAIYLIARMCHCIAKICILKKLKKIEAMRIPSIRRKCVTKSESNPATLVQNITEFRGNEQNK